MTKGFRYFLVVLLSCTLGLQSCSDELPDGDGDIFNQQVCDGGTEDSYFPLTVGNSWKYSQNNSFEPIVRIVEGNVPFNANVYYIVVDEQHNDDMTMFLRMDTLGNIVQYRGNADELYLPANPVVGDIWVNTGDTLSVSATNATLSTTYCDYRNVLVVQKRNQSGILEDTRYYVKGIGEIYSYAEGDSSTRTLYDVDLK